MHQRCKAVVVREEEDTSYLPYNGIGVMGFSPAEQEAYLTNNQPQLTSPPATQPNKESHQQLDILVQRSEPKHSRFQNLLPLIVWGYAVEFYLYVIGLQLFYPRSAQWPFAAWLPTHLDYLGETALIFSFFLVTAAIIWGTKRSLQPKQQETSPPPKLS